VIRSRFALLVACLLLAIVLGVTIVVPNLVALWAEHGSSHPSSAVSSARVTVPTSSECHSVNGLPDPICTPGVADPHVTQENIQTTICLNGYTTKVRPSSRYTDALKQQQIKEYGYTDSRLADYEEDHLIPLELGGHPTDPKNLWPEPLNGVYPATQKDAVENSLHAKVCAGLMALDASRAAIAKNWESVP